MPRGMTNPENMQRGICSGCGGPTEAIWKDRQLRQIHYVCVMCQKPSRECQCAHVTPAYCPDCGERIGDDSKERGWAFRSKEGHRCKK